VSQDEEQNIYPRMIRKVPENRNRGLPVFSGNAWNPRTLSSSHLATGSERKGWRTDRYLPSSPGKHQCAKLLAQNIQKMCCFFIPR